MRLLKLASRGHSLSARWRLATLAAIQSLVHLPLLRMITRQNLRTSISVVCDLRSWRPTYGDAMAVFVLCRVLAEANNDVKLVMDGSNGLREDWFTDGIASRAEMFRYFETLYLRMKNDSNGAGVWEFMILDPAHRQDHKYKSSKLVSALRQEIQVLVGTAAVFQNIVRVLVAPAIRKVLEVFRDQPTNSFRIDLGGRLTDMQYLSPRLLNQIWRLPISPRVQSKFFLNNLAFSSRERLDLGLPDKFITVNLRDTQYKVERNLSGPETMRLLKVIAAHTNNKHIVLTASRLVELRVKEELAKIEGPAKNQLLGQPETGYLGAIRTVLSSDLHLQELGGGVAVAAIFSRVPYVITSFNAGCYPRPRRGRLMSWSGPSQKYYVVRGRAKSHSTFIKGLGSLIPLTNLLDQ